MFQTESPSRARQINSTSEQEDIKSGLVYLSPEKAVRGRLCFRLYSKASFKTCKESAPWCNTQPPSPYTLSPCKNTPGVLGPTMPPSPTRAAGVHALTAAGRACDGEIRKPGRMQTLNKELILEEDISRNFLLDRFPTAAHWRDNDGAPYASTLRMFLRQSGGVAVDSISNSRQSSYAFVLFPGWCNSTLWTLSSWSKAPQASRLVCFYAQNPHTCINKESLGTGNQPKHNADDTTFTWLNKKTADIWQQWRDTYHWSSALWRKWFARKSHRICKNKWCQAHTYSNHF